MKLSTQCKGCNNDITVKSFAATRVDLAQTKGDTFNVNCKDCGTNTSVHVNDVEAEGNYLFTLLAVIASVVLTVVFWDMGFIAFATIALPFWIGAAESRKAAAFNAYRRSR